MSVALNVSAAYQDKLVDAETRSFHLTETNKANVLTSLDEREIELRKPARTHSCISSIAFPREWYVNTGSLVNAQDYD